MEHRQWLSVHIFYHSNTNPLIINCLKPMIDVLRREEWIQRYFFIKYWVEGPHIRLRLLPTEKRERDDLKQLIETRLVRYLSQRPSLMTVDNTLLQPMYKDLFAAEYGAEKWATIYGEGGEMPIRANNSFAYIDYEPEYTRYGGVKGVELAEWHFEHSSDIVIRLLQETNVHVRDIQLGLAAQLMLYLCYGLLRDDQKVIDFLDRYMEFWGRAMPPDAKRNLDTFEKKAAWAHPDFQARLAKIRGSVLNNTLEQLTATEPEWHVHIQKLRQKIAALAMKKQLIFGPGNATEQTHFEDLDTISSILLHGYVHMTNNRLGISLLEEVYLSYLLKRGIAEKMSFQEVLL